MSGPATISTAGESDFVPVIDASFLKLLLYIIVRKMVQSLEDADNRKLGYNSRCALHYT